jgi:hypothetical protein
MAVISNGDPCLCFGTSKIDLIWPALSARRCSIIRTEQRRTFLLDILIIFSLPDVLFDRLIDVLMHDALS